MTINKPVALMEVPDSNTTTKEKVNADISQVAVTL